MLANTDINQFINLPSLPPPSVVEALDAEDILAEVKTLFLTLEPNYELIHEDDPVMKLLQLVAYRELVWRTRVNEAARANVLSFSKGTDLDHLAAFYAVERLTGETDDELRYRVQLKAMGWVGTWAYYKFWAKTASLNVADAAVYSPNHGNGYNMGGRVYVAVMSKDNEGIPSPQLVQQVRSVLASDSVRILTDILSVEAAAARIIDVTARVTLKPHTPYDVFLGLAETLRAAWTAVAGLGYDIARSWLDSILQVTGVHNVDVVSPAIKVTVVAPNEFPVIGSLNLVFSGFSDYEGAEIDDTERRRLNRLLYDYYLQYAVEQRRTHAQLIADLAEKDAPGIIQPTIRGLAGYLRITNIRDEDEEFLPEDEIAFLIHRRLIPMYEAGSVLPVT